VNEESEFPEKLELEAEKMKDLPYGSNPGQPAAIYKLLGYTGGVPDWKLLFGDPLSSNNYRDAALANRLLDGMGSKPTVAIAKHGIFAGVCWAKTVMGARRRARQCDPEANFGGVEVYTHPLDWKTAYQIKENADDGDIRDIIAAPAFEKGTFDMLEECRKGKYRGKMRVVQTAPFSTCKYDYRIHDGALLVERLPDYSQKLKPEQIIMASERMPTKCQLAKMLAAEDIAWRVPSNGVVIGDGAYDSDKNVLEAFWTYGIGTSTKRNRAAKMAADNANDLPMIKRFDMPEAPRAVDAVAASDGFFPFRDSLDTLMDAGVDAVLSGAGALREKSVVETANFYNVVLVLSKRRIFSH
jgi:phosphoribosylaminoimidazolecarboxamide formyltransferase/IMP cyclohydrolase